MPAYVTTGSGLSFLKPALCGILCAVALTGHLAPPALACTCSEPGITLNASDVSACVGESVTIPASASDDDLAPGATPPLCPTNPDSVTITGTGPYVYNTAGVYYVTVRATDSSGTETATKSVEITVADAQLSDIVGPCTVCTRSAATFTIGVSPDEFADKVTWSSGGSPSTGSGLSYTTSWDAPGAKAVTAAVCGHTRSISVYVSDPCPTTSFAGVECTSSTTQVTNGLGPGQWGYTVPCGFDPTGSACFDCNAWRFQLDHFVWAICITLDDHGALDTSQNVDCAAVHDLQTWWDCAGRQTAPHSAAVSYFPADCIRQHEEDHAAYYCEQFAALFSGKYSSLLGAVSSQECDPAVASARVYEQAASILEAYVSECALLTNSTSFQQQAEARAYAVMRTCIDDQKTVQCIQLSYVCPECNP